MNNYNNNQHNFSEVPHQEAKHEGENRGENHSSGNKNSWASNPALNQIDPGKLQMLMSMADQARGKSQADLLPFLMSMGGSGKLNFSPDEMDTIIGVMKLGRSPQEIRKIDRMCAMLKQMRR